MTADGETASATLSSATADDGRRYSSAEQFRSRTRCRVRMCAGQVPVALEANLKRRARSY